jgi:hypothetical protein
MSIRNRVLKLLQDEVYHDDLNFVPSSKEYKCIKKYNEFINQNDEVLVKKIEKEKYHILYFADNEIYFLRIEEKELHNNFKLLRNEKIKMIKNQLWESGMK